MDVFVGVVGIHGELDLGAAGQRGKVSPNLTQNVIGGKGGVFQNYGAHDGYSLAAIGRL